MENRKKGLIKKTWERCKSMRGQQQSKAEGSSSAGGLFKSKSWAALSEIPISSAEKGGSSRTSSRRRREEIPDGCFPVYVGERRERFVMRAKKANHPLFRALLEEAEMEYGFCSEGPLLLPCDPEVFSQVLIEMQGDTDQHHGRTCNCSFPTRSPGSYNRLVSTST